MHVIGEQKGEKMSDLIDRQAAIEAIECVGYDFSESGLSVPELEEVCEAVGEVEQDMIMRIRHLPSAQPEIIQCPDCKYGVHSGCGDRYICTVNYELRMEHDSTFYCGYAKRRDE